MPVQKINIGAAPNDKTGDSLREAFALTNAAIDQVNTNTDAIAEKVDKAPGMGLSQNSFTNEQRDKLNDLEGQVGENTVAIDGKVDKAAGMGLSQNSFTNEQRDKLNGLEGTHWRGTFLSVSALQAALPAANSGDYADVDTGVGSDVQRYIWDVSDAKWVQQGAATTITAAQVKVLYENNPNTNAFTDAEESKLAGIEPGATANQTDLFLRNRANHTGTQEISTVSGLSAALSGLSDRASALESKSPNGVFVDRTASRAFGVTYTHSGTRKLTVEVIVRGTAAGSAIGYVNGVSRQQFGFGLADWYATVHLDVFPGETYQVNIANSSQSLVKWTEGT